MSEEPRYAIYFVPTPESRLYHFGSALLGYDCYAGEPVAKPGSLGLSPSEWRAVTEEPRTYGFHATLKAPFYLQPPYREQDLVDAFRRFAAAARPVAAFLPVVAELDAFIAIVPGRHSPAIDALAADCVTAFDPFRAPMRPQDRARRLHAALTGREIENLDRWGYPYVFVDFRFHMTLTGRIDAPRRGEILKVLRVHFADLHGQPTVAVDHLALLRQDRPAERFRVLCHAPVTGD